MKKWLCLLLALLMVLGMGSVTVAEEEETEEDISVLGSMEDGVYTNEAFGFRIALPDGWNYNDEDHIFSANQQEGESITSWEELADKLEEDRSLLVMETHDADASGDLHLSFAVKTADTASFDIHEWVKGNLFTAVQLESDKEWAPKIFNIAGKGQMGMEKIGKESSGAQMYEARIAMKGEKLVGELIVSADISRQDEIETVLRKFKPLEDESAADTWSLIGTICDTNWEKDFPMVETKPGVWTSAVLPMKAGDEYKFRANEDRSANVGQGGQDGANFVADRAGSFILTLDLNTNDVTCVEKTDDDRIPSVVGTICGTNWDTDFPMTECGFDVWQSMPLEMKAGDEIKVRVNGTEDNGYLGKDCDPAGDSIVAPADGVYVVTLGQSIQWLTLTTTQREEVQPELELPASTDQWSVIGTINGSNWNTDFFMHEVKRGVWVSEALEMNAVEEFKVRLNGAWDTYYGVVMGLCVRSGPSVKIEADGLYVVRLDLNQLTLTWVAQ
jgi:hypothetical protein